jgi:hypothetical protein
MWNRNVLTAGLGVSAVALFAGCADVGPTLPGAVEPESEALFGRAAPALNEFQGTLDAAFVRIAGQVPGFGGLYYADGVLNVVMVPGEQVVPMSQAVAVLREEFPHVRHDRVRVVEGRYDFAELNAMHLQATQLLGLAGTVFTDADEVRNRIVIGVEDDAAAAAVRRHVAMLGLPAEAVIIEHALPIVQEQSLRSRVRPVAGGLQINFGGSLCTHGFNVRAPSRPGVQGFVTNSHCSSQQGNMLRTPYWQHTGSPDTLGANFIGREEHDRPGSTGGNCPAGRQCRWSDALGARYAPGVDNAFGAIYRTLFHGTTGTTPGSLDIDPANPRWEIVGELPFPIVGDSVHKTGRTNGWTTGPVNTTCQNVNVGGAGNWTMWCQERIFTWSSGGDSGSPYYQRIGQSNQIRLAGIHWGSDGQGNTVMSSINNIRCENEGPVPWITHPGQTPPSALCAR